MTRTPAPSAAPASTVPAVPAEDRAARRCVAALTARGATVAVAESLTAGQVTARLADVPGASTVLRGAVVAYATPLKHEVLGVDVGLLSERGPVDEDVARQMCAGVARLLGADHAVATTGVAGPGAADGHDAGTVWIAALGPAGTRTRLLRLAGTRPAVRRAATRAALALLGELVADEVNRGRAGADAPATSAATPQIRSLSADR